MGKLKERDIVDHLVRNWDTYFKTEELFFYKTEYTVTDNWRADILAYVWAPYPRNPEIDYRIPVFIEVKYNNFRDLIFELEKGLEFINRKSHNPDYPRYLAVIANDAIDQITKDYILKNNIPLYIYSMEDEDLLTLSISMYQNTKDT